MIIPLPHCQDHSRLLWNRLEKLAGQNGVTGSAVFALCPALMFMVFLVSLSQLLPGTFVTPCARTWVAGAQDPSTASPAGFLIARRSA